MLGNLLSKAIKALIINTRDIGNVAYIYTIYFFPLQDEIDRVLKKHDGKLCYDAVKEMVYLEWVFKEGMRMFPSLGFLLRRCTKPYTFSDLTFTIDKDTKVLIPLQSMHNDPKYFKDPEVFRPERFSPDEFDSIKKFVYLPFGDGPRACIGKCVVCVL